MRTRVESPPSGQPEDGLQVTPELLESYWTYLRERGAGEPTIRGYGQRLPLLWRHLPDRTIRRGTLQEAVEALQDEGYANQTINGLLAVTNGLLEFAGRRELGYAARLERELVQPELTRREYLRLLGAAKALGKERSYLIIKVFATLGLHIQDLPTLTLEVARSGTYVESGESKPIPACLQDELLDYAHRQGILGGPLFLTDEGRPMSRTRVTASIKPLAGPARVEEEKCTPRCLRKLYQQTQDTIRSNLTLLLEQAHERMLEREQQTVGWKAV